MKLEEIFKILAERNDKARKLGLNVTITKQAGKLPNLEGLLYKVRSYNSFTKRIDPHGFHDMGRFEWHGKEVVWQIDYYDSKLKHFIDPMDSNCKRVLTVMLASEY